MGNPRGGCGKQPDKQLSDESEEDIRDNPGRRDEDKSLPPVRDVVEVDRNRSRPSKTRKKEHEGPDRIEVFEWVEGQPPRPFGGRVAHPVSDPAVGHLMDDNGKKKGNGNESKSQWISSQQIQKSHLGYPAI